MVYTHVVAFDEVRKMYAHLLTEQHVLLSSVSSSSRLDEMVFRIVSSENFRSENVLGVQEKGPEDRRTCEHENHVSGCEQQTTETEIHCTD